MRHDYIESGYEYIASVQSDGSNVYTRVYRKRPKYEVIDEDGNVIQITPPDDSIRGYMPVHPGKHIEKRKLSEEEQYSKDLFIDIYNSHPYSEWKSYNKEMKKLERNGTIQSGSCVPPRTNEVLCDQSSPYPAGLDVRSRNTRIPNSFAFYKQLVIEKLQEEGKRYDDYFSDSWLATLISIEYNNAKQRIHTFEMKAYNNKFKYWVTITWDPEKFLNEDDFRKSLKILFDHLATRNHVRVIGVFERGTSGTERLHFHGFMMITDVSLLPPGFDFKIENHFNFKHKNIHNYLSCDYFTSRFGINEFCDISMMNQNDSDYKAAVDYCLKYMEKDREHFYEGRNIPSVVYTPIVNPEDFCLLLFALSYFYPGRIYFNDDVYDTIDTFMLKQ